MTPRAFLFWKAESAAQADARDPVWQIPLSRVGSVHVELGGRFCLELLLQGGGRMPLQLLASGQATGARRWADAVASAKAGLRHVDEATRLRECLRHCLRRREGGGTAVVDPAALRHLLTQFRMAPALMPQDDKLQHCLAVGPAGHVSWQDHRGEALLRGVLKAVGRVESVEVWENEVCENASSQQAVEERGEGHPPRWQRLDGSELPGGPADNAPCREGWLWLSGWAVDCDAGVFGADGWQYASSFAENEWRPSRGEQAESVVRRRRWFRVQVRLGGASPVLGHLRTSSAEELRGNQGPAGLRLARARSERRFSPYGSPSKPPVAPRATA